jgi:hypothetical protein
LGAQGAVVMASIFSVVQGRIKLTGYADMWRGKFGNIFQRVNPYNHSTHLHFFYIVVLLLLGYYYKIVYRGCQSLSAPLSLALMYILIFVMEREKI